MIVELTRKIVPRRTRLVLGSWLVKKASISWPTLYLYLRILYGRIPRELQFSKDGLCSLTHKGSEIVAPRDSALVFLEVFQSEVYERIFRPMEGNIVIDIGAYVGMFTVKASKVVGDRGWVIAVEPEPISFTYLKRNTRRLVNVWSVQKAIYNQNGRMALFPSSCSAGYNLIRNIDKGSIEVETITLDDLVTQLDLPRVDFIKLDAEGVELQVLEGAEQVLKGDVKLSIASYHSLPDGKSELPMLTSFLEERGFNVTMARGLGGYIYAEKNT